MGCNRKELETRISNFNLTVSDKVLADDGSKQQTTAADFVEVTCWKKQATKHYYRLKQHLDVPMRNAVTPPELLSDQQQHHYSSYLVWMSVNVKQSDAESSMPTQSNPCGEINIKKYISMFRNKEMAKPLYSSDIWTSVNGYQTSKVHLDSICTAHSA